MASRLFTTPQAALELDVPEALIRVWKARGRAYPADSMRGSGRNGQAPLWDLEDLKPLADQYHQERARRAERSDG